MKPDGAPPVIRMDPADPMHSPGSLAHPWGDSAERHNQSETSSNCEVQPRTRAKYRTMVSILNAIEENSCKGAKGVLIEPPDGDLTNSELWRTARDDDETPKKRSEIEEVSYIQVSSDISQNKQIAANGDYFFDTNLSAFYENLTQDQKQRIGSIESKKEERHLNFLGATSIPASLESLRVDRSRIFSHLNRRSQSYSGHFNSNSISPGVSESSSSIWFSENEDPSDNGEVRCLESSAQEQDTCAGEESKSKGFVRHRHGSGDSVGDFSVCSDGCRIVGNGTSGRTPAEVGPWGGVWMEEMEEDGSGLDVVLFRPLGVFDRDAEEDDETPIVSSRGTVRGVRNKVKVGIAVFDDSQNTCKNYRLLEKGRVVVYTTGVMVIRETHERCQTVKKILQNHMIQFEERDISLTKDFQRQLSERLGNEHFELPQTFAGGFSLGGLEEIEHLNETGVLRRMFKNVKKVRSVATSCCKCGGYSYVPCPSCRGSKKSSRRNAFTEQFCALRCTNCDDNGLTRCDRCAY